MSTLQQAIQYIHNANGGATRTQFEEDFEPIGGMLWRDLNQHDYAYLDGNGKVRLTDRGAALLQAHTKTEPPLPVTPEEDEAWRELEKRQ